MQSEAKAALAVNIQSRNACGVKHLKQPCENRWPWQCWGVPLLAAKRGLVAAWGPSCMLLGHFHVLWVNAALSLPATSAAAAPAHQTDDRRRVLMVLRCSEQSHHQMRADTLPEGVIGVHGKLGEDIDARLARQCGVTCEGIIDLHECQVQVSHVKKPASLTEADVPVRPGTKIYCELATPGNKRAHIALEDGQQERILQQQMSNVFDLDKECPGTNGGVSSVRSAKVKTPMFEPCTCESSSLME
jgi:hypothetical protein